MAYCSDKRARGPLLLVTTVDGLMERKSARERVLERHEDLPAKQLQVARFLIDHDDLAAFLSVRELAERAGVGPATVVRLCRELGYDGYSDYQEEARRRLLEHDTFVQRLRRRIEAGAFGGDITRQMAAIHVSNIENTLGLVSAEDLDRAVSAIRRASTIRIIGSGLSASVAVAAEHAFSVLGVRARAVVNGGLAHTPALSLIEENDLVIAISVWRYMKDTVQAAKAADEAGATVIALTDSPIAPIARFSDVVFVANTDGLVHSRSQIGLMSLVHLLGSATAAAAPEESLEALERLDRLYREHGVLWEE